MALCIFAFSILSTFYAIIWKEKTKNGSVNVPIECRGTIERALAKDVSQHYSRNNAPVKVAPQAPEFSEVVY